MAKMMLASACHGVLTLSLSSSLFLSHLSLAVYPVLLSLSRGKKQINWLTMKLCFIISHPCECVILSQHKLYTVCINALTLAMNLTWLQIWLMNLWNVILTLTHAYEALFNQLTYNLFACFTHKRCLSVRFSKLIWLLNLHLCLVNRW